MSTARSRFSSHRENVWRQLAEQFAGDFTVKGTWQTGKVEARADGWTVTLDIRSVAGYKSAEHFTRFRAPFLNPDGFRFAIYRKTFIHTVGTFLGMQDIQVGYPLLDRGFVIQSNSEGEVRRLLSNATIRELLEKEPDLYLHVQQTSEDGSRESEAPQASSEATDELYLEVPGLIKDAGRLREVYGLFAEVLRTLTHLGSAYEDDPELGI
jgi:hypothetical protein